MAADTNDTMPPSAFKRLRAQESGFTLIEMLVVILIIGILAAIAIPAFVGQREKAQDAVAKSAVRAALVAAETYYNTTNPPTYTGLDAAKLRDLEPSLNAATFSWCEGGFARDTFCIGVLSKTGTVFAVVKDASQPKVWGWPNTTTRTCQQPGRGSCVTPKAGEFGGWGGTW